MLEGNEASRVAALFEEWWRTEAKPFSPRRETAARSKRDADEPFAGKLPLRYFLPPRPQTPTDRIEAPEKG